MNTNPLFSEREAQRLEAFHHLRKIRPGNPSAKPWLEILGEVERSELENPCGLLYTTAQKQRESVSRTYLDETFFLVFFADVHEPWKTRFESATFLSARSEEGWYGSDWLLFLERWEKDEALVDRHRRMLEVFEREKRRHAIHRQMDEVTAKDPDLDGLISELRQLNALDDPRIMPLDEVVRGMRIQIMGGTNVIVDRHVPLPWNIRLSLYLGLDGVPQDPWRESDWQAFVLDWRQRPSPDSQTDILL